MSASSLLLSLLAASASSQAEPAQPDQNIIVTGRGLDPGRSEQVYDVLTIGRDRLAASPSNRLEDILRDIPGFQQFRRSDSRSANPTSQGATFRALGGNASARALILLDGVPQSDPFGGWIGWAAIDPRRLGLIRVVRGGGTGANGPGALAGTIELSSARPEEVHGLRADLAYGSRDSLDGFFGIGAPLGDGFATFSASYAQGDGFIPIVASQRGPVDRASPYRQASVAVRAVTPLGAATELQANVAAFTDSRERGTALSDIHVAGADASLRLVGRGRLPFSALVYLQARDFSNRFAAVADDRASLRPALDQHSVPATGIGARAEIRPIQGRTELRLGADWRDTQGRTQELFQFANGGFLRGRAAGGRTRTIGAFAEAGWERGPLTLSAGGRIDRWWISDGRLREHALSGGSAPTTTLFPDRAGWEASGRAGAGWRVANPLTLRAAVYRGWRLPTLNELYRPFRVGPDATAANALLDPERLEGAEMGVELRPADGARIAVTAFVNRLEDAISNVTLGQGPGVFPGVGFVSAAGRFRQRQNLGAVVSRGIEIDAAWSIGPWRLGAGYSFADARIEADGAAAALDGLRPAQAPRHSASASLGWDGRGGRSAAMTLRYVGAQYEDDLNAVRIEDALTLDAILIFPLGARLALVGRAENLTDARIVSGISGAGVVERATPRTLWLGLRWRG